MRALAAAAASLWLLASPALAAGKVLTVCDDVQEPSSLNPYQVFSEKVHTILQQVVEGLVRFGPEGEIEPALAERWERIDDNTVRFHLRRGVRFHNGEPFDAGSVKFSLSKYVAPETHYPGLSFINSVLRVDIVDDYTVDVVTRGRDGLLMNRLAAWIHIVPAKYYAEVGDAGFAKRPVGTGAFRFASWDPGRAITLEKNADYWMKDYPKLDKLVFRFIPAEGQLEELLAGRIDIVTELPGTATLTVAKSNVARVVKKQTFYTLASNFNTTRGATTDRRVRQALNLAIDRRELIRYDLMGNGTPLATLSMPGEEGYNPDLKPYPYDPKRALALLREAGFPNGMRLKALVKSTGEKSAHILKAQWKRIGVDLEYEVKNDPAFMNDLKAGDLDLAFGGCPDPMAHVFFIQSISLFSASPWSIVKVPDYDRKLMEMAATLDPKERVALAQRLDRYIYDEALALFTYQRIKTYGVRNGVAFRPYVTGMPYLFSADVPAAAPAEKMAKKA